ncbi:hypothetical protein BDR04DRAFT_1010961, partial [Suillus decipiens]
ISLAQHLPKQHISMLLWLRTKHISLNQHLFYIGKSPMPNCPHCEEMAEIVMHFLLSCSHYARARHILTSTHHCHTSSLSYLLSNPKASVPLIHYVNSMSHLWPTFSDISPQPHNDR